MWRLTCSRLGMVKWHPGRSLRGRRPGASSRMPFTFLNNTNGWGRLSLRVGGGYCPDGKGNGHVGAGSTNLKRAILDLEKDPLSPCLSEDFPPRHRHPRSRSLPSAPMYFLSVVAVGAVRRPPQVPVREEMAPTDSRSGQIYRSESCFRKSFPQAAPLCRPTDLPDPTDIFSYTPRESRRGGGALSGLEKRLEHLPSSLAKGLRDHSRGKRES